MPKMTQKEFDALIGKRIESKKEWDRDTDKLIPACIDGFNSSVKGDNTVGNKTRFMQFLHPDAMSHPNAVQVCTYLQTQTNIVGLSYNADKGKLKITLPDGEHKISKPEMSWLEYLAAERAKKKPIEVTEEKLARQLFALKRKAASNGFDWSRVSDKAKEMGKAA